MLIQTSTNPKETTAEEFNQMRILIYQLITWRKITSIW